MPGAFFFATLSAGLLLYLHITVITPLYYSHTLYINEKFRRLRYNQWPGLHYKPGERTTHHSGIGAATADLFLKQGGEARPPSLSLPCLFSFAFSTARRGFQHLYFYYYFILINFKD